MPIPCPVCVNDMQVIQYLDIELDYCRACGGLWFDNGEMEKILSKKNVPRRLTHPIAYDFSQRKKEEGERLCPRCGVVMKVINHKGVAVDVCMQCQGIWLDRYELSKLMGITEGLPKSDFDYSSFERHSAEIKALGPASDNVVPGPGVFGSAFQDALIDIGLGIRYRH